MKPVLTVAEIAAVLGITPSGVRQIVRRSNGEIRPIGKRGRAKIYDPQQFIRHAGGHDRLTHGQGVSQ